MPDDVVFFDGEYGSFAATLNAIMTISDMARISPHIKLLPEDDFDSCFRSRGCGAEGFVFSGSASLESLHFLPQLSHRGLYLFVIRLQ